MADFSVSASSLMSPLASITSRVPTGLSEAQTLAREATASSKQIVASNLPISADNPNGQTSSTRQSNQLNSQTSQPVQDSTGVSVGTSSTSNNPASNANNTMQPSESEAQADQAKIEQVVSQLKARDREVRAHEQAHIAAAGGYATGMSFSYQTGPDGQRYAIGGEVGIDTSPIANDPQATMVKAQTIQRAAMAPAEPSSQDYRVASAAAQMMVQAQQALAEQDSEAVSSQADEESDSAEKAEASKSSTSSAPSTSHSISSPLSTMAAVNVLANPSDIAERQSSLQTEPAMLSERNGFELRQQLQSNRPQTDLAEASR